MATLERDQSEFNMAVSYLNRLNSLFYVCNEAAMCLDAYGWLNTLITLFRELSTEMKDEEIEDKEKELEDMFNEVNKNLSDFSKTGTRSVTPELYWKLHKFELFLRKVVKTSGLQMKMAEDARKALK